MSEKSPIPGRLWTIFLISPCVYKSGDRPKEDSVLGCNQVLGISHQAHLTLREAHTLPLQGPTQACLSLWLQATSLTTFPSCQAPRTSSTSHSASSCSPLDPPAVINQPHLLVLPLSNFMAVPSKCSISGCKNEGSYNITLLLPGHGTTKENKHDRVQKD